MEARGYGALRPYVVPATLEELTGPIRGVISLPRHLDWGPERSYDLEQLADARLMYMRVIREGATPDDLRHLLNVARLRRLWTELVLPPRVRALWLDRFPELLTLRSDGTYVPWSTTMMSQARTSRRCSTEQNFATASTLTHSSPAVGSVATSCATSPHLAT